MGSPLHAPRALPRRFFARPADRVAVDLLGRVLVHRSEDGWCGGVIVETEAYLADGDPGSHAHRGPTPRNASMFGPGGIAYVYRIYGLHLCFNVVTGSAGRGEAVLVRALEPTIGIDAMQRRRNGSRDLCNGPARLVEALGIGIEHDGASLLEAPFALLEGEPVPPQRVVLGRRIGLGKGERLALRSYVRDSGAVS
ncbi:MAG: DNA-3-methyladenine glycosylase [Planctomycetota bacterium]